MDLLEIRRRVIVALFSDDYLQERLALKGGNALSLVYNISPRTSFDLDFSLPDDFSSPEEACKRMSAALERHFAAQGYAVFDVRLQPKPRLKTEDERPWWGGYQLTFKLIQAEKQRALMNRLDKMSIEAHVVGPAQERRVTVDFSKHEYTTGKIERELDHSVIYVYSPEMIVLEKLRALCQQMPDYLLTNPRGRAQDFYDIHRAVTTVSIDLSTNENRKLLRHIFRAKQVPLVLLRQMDQQREVHRPDWQSVEVSIKGPETLQGYDFYFDFVLDQIRRLEPLGDEEPPL